MGTSTWLREISGLDPRRDHLRIVYLVSCFEFPFDLTRADELAIYRTFAVPRIARLLDSTAEFTRRTQKRYDDTKLILSELVEHGYESERGAAALQRMNRIHGQFNIVNEDKLYVLSTLVYEPARWMQRYAYRPMTHPERLAIFYFWREVGQRMGIEGIPASYEDYERFNVDYERRMFQYTDAGHRVAAATRDLFIAWVLPRPLIGLARPAIHALMDDPLREALGFPKAPAWLRTFVARTLRNRSRMSRLFGDRRKPHLNTARRHGTYPRGYTLNDLGPPAGTRAGQFRQASGGPAPKGPE